jgi:SAM-dependent methyltransferase
VRKKLADCEKQVSFVRDFINTNTFKGNVIEVGSGNGKLLYALESNGLIKCSTGYELSNSRVEFSEKLSNYISCKKVTIICGDFLDSNVELESVDLIIGVDIVLQLIAPISDDSETKFFQKVFSSLKPGGVLILELLDFTSMIKMCELYEGKHNLWKEFSEEDPWQFGLDQLEIINNDVIWKKRFFSRDRNIPDSFFDNVLRHYTFEMVRDKLEMMGFNNKNIKKHYFWKENGDIPKDEFIITAIK